MKLKTLLTAVTLSSVVFTAIAQQVPTKIIYKWQQGGETHYAEWPPHGINNYQRLNDQGMVLNEIPNLESFLVIRPERPAAQVLENQANKVDQKEPLPSREGTITRQKRCESAQQNLKTISEKQTIYEEDQSGNLIPLSKEEVDSRRKQAQSEVEKFCSEPTVSSERS